MTQRSALVAREVEKVIPARDDADPWRATNRVWTAITHLTVRRRDARIYGVPCATPTTTFCGSLMRRDDPGSSHDALHVLRSQHRWAVS